MSVAMSFFSFIELLSPTNILLIFVQTRLFGFSYFSRYAIQANQDIHAH